MQLRGLKGRINVNYYWSCLLIYAAKTHERLLFQTKANTVLKEGLLLLCSLILGDDLRPREITSADGRVKLGCLFKKRLPLGWDTPVIHGCVCVCVLRPVGWQWIKLLCGPLPHAAVPLSPTTQLAGMLHAHMYTYTPPYSYLDLLFLIVALFLSSLPLVSSASGLNKPSLSSPLSIHYSPKINGDIFSTREAFICLLIKVLPAFAVFIPEDNSVRTVTWSKSQISIIMRHINKCTWIGHIAQNAGDWVVSDIILTVRAEAVKQDNGGGDSWMSPLNVLFAMGDSLSDQNEAMVDWRDTLPGERQSKPDGM